MKAERTQTDAAPDLSVVDFAAGRTVIVDDADSSCAASWNGYVSRASHASLYHDYRWRALIESVFGSETHYLVARDGVGEVCGVLPLARLRSRLFGDFMVSLPYLNYGGVLADSPAAEQALVETAIARARQLRVSHIEFRHRAETHLDLPARENKVTMLLDLPESEAALWNSFKGKLRAQIRRPEKEGVSLRAGGVELVDDFYSVFANNMRDLGTPVYSKRLFSAIFAAFPHESKLFIVDLQGRPVAAGLVLAHGSTVEIPWASSLRRANSLGVNMWLYWSVLRDAVARGFRRFDFGRSSKDSGTYRFKAQWGAQPEQLRWHYWLPQGAELPNLTPNSPKYRAAVALWKRLPLGIANMLGPSIVRHLP
jgi:serine/alanine adding enzyme